MTTHPVCIIWRNYPEQVVESIHDAKELVEIELEDLRDRGYETRWIFSDTAQLRKSPHCTWLTIARIRPVRPRL